MAEKYLKVIQDGVTSFVPDNSNNRRFWTKQNSKVAKSQYGQRELVTVMPASDDEVAFMNQPTVSTAPVAPTVTSTELEKMQALFAQQQEQIASQQLLINKLLLGDISASEDSGQKDKGKPGPKPKLNNDGQANQTEGTQQA